MSRRNAAILVVALIFTGFVITLVVYAFQILSVENPEGDQDPFWKEPDWQGVGTITIGGHVDKTLSLNLTEIKTSFTQVEKEFHFKNDYGTEWSDRFKGASLKSIIQVLELNITNTFEVQFVAEDGFKSAKINSTTIWNHPEDIIVAYEENGAPLKPKLEGGDGPFHSVVERGVIPDPNSQSAITWLAKIVINGDPAELEQLEGI